MSTLNKAVNTTNTTMKGGEKMNKKAIWNEIYSGKQECLEEILKGLYDTKNYEELHRAQWIWLSLDGTREEADWFDTFGIPKIRNHCFACKVAQEAYSCIPKRYEEEIADFDQYRPAFCPCCPLTDWAEEECFDGLYAQWSEASFEEREEVAWQIASMEWK